MTDYTELVKALRYCSGLGRCRECPRYNAEKAEKFLGCGALADAADAIEELNKNWKYCSDILNLALKVSGLPMTALVKLYETEVRE